MLGIGYIEIAVWNLPLAVHYFTSALGFHVVCQQSRGELIEAVLRQRQAVIILVSPMCCESELAKKIFKQGDFIRDVALIFDDVEDAYQQAIQGGAKSVCSPKTMSRPMGEVYQATIQLEGRVRHTLLNGQAYGDVFCSKDCSNGKIFVDIDHVAICVGERDLNYWQKLYETVFGLSLGFEENIDTGRTGMLSKVMKSESDKVKLVLVSPIRHKKISQIEEFLLHNKGVGIQHVAFSTNDILNSVKHMVGQGVSFLQPPTNYYSLLDYPSHIGRADAERYGILIDREGDNYLLQLFSQPLFTRPTFFFEVIQRLGHTSFGAKNVRQLFESIEKAQVAREGDVQSSLT